MKITTLLCILSLIQFTALSQDPLVLDIAFGDDGMFLYNHDNYQINIPSKNNRTYDTHFDDSLNFTLFGNYHHTDNGFHDDQYFISKFNSQCELDTSFGINGSILGDFYVDTAIFFEAVFQTIEQSNGKWLLIGCTKYGGTWRLVAIRRLLPDFSLDTMFALNGTLVTNIKYSSNFDYKNRWAVYLDSTERIIVLGSDTTNSPFIVGTDTFYINTSTAAERYLIDGTLDSSFGVNGKIIYSSSNTFIKSLCLSSGKVLVETLEMHPATPFHLFRLNNDGTLDNSFSPDSTVLDEIGIYHQREIINMLELPDGKVLISTMAYFNSGTGIHVMRINTDGSKDSTFNSPLGYQIFYNYPNELRSYAMFYCNNKIYLGGGIIYSTNCDMMMICLNGDGTVDTLFGSNGMYTLDLGLGLAEREWINDFQYIDGKLYVIGYANWCTGAYTFIRRYEIGDVNQETEILKQALPDVNVFPNPTSGLLNIETSQRIRQVHVYDVLGNNLAKNVQFKGSKYIDVRNLPKGIYILEVVFENGQKKSKRIIYTE